MPSVPPLFAFSTNRYHRAKRSIPGKLSKGATPLLEAKWNSHNFASQLPDCQSAVMPSQSYGQNYIIKNLEMILCQFYAGLCVCSLQLRTVVPPYSIHQVCPIVHPVAVVRSSSCAPSLQVNTAPSYRCTFACALTTVALVHPVIKVTLAHSLVPSCKLSYSALVHSDAVVHPVAVAPCCTSAPTPASPARILSTTE